MLTAAIIIHRIMAKIIVLIPLISSASLMRVAIDIPTAPEKIAVKNCVLNAAFTLCFATS